MTEEATAAAVPAQMTQSELVAGMKTAMGPAAGAAVAGADEGAAAAGAAAAADAAGKAEAEAAAKAEAEAQAATAAAEAAAKAEADAAAAGAAEAPTEAEKLAAELAAARAEAETLKAQQEAARVDQVLKAGLLPELMRPEQADTLKSYDTTLGALVSAKKIQRDCIEMIETGNHLNEEGKEKVFSGTDFGGKPFSGTARQWRNLAEDARDELNIKVQELAPVASKARREAAERQAEIYRLGLAVVRTREAAAAAVSAAAAAKGVAPTKVTVKAAAGTGVSRAPMSPKNKVLETFKRSSKAPEDIAGAMGQLLTQP